MKKSKILLVAVLFFLLGIVSVQAEEKQELVNAMGVEFGFELSGTDMNMNVSLPEGYVLNEDHNYMVKFVNEGDSKPVDLPKNKMDSYNLDEDHNDITKWKSINSSYKIIIADDYYMLAGYDYAYFLACDANECVISDEPARITKPELQSYGERYQILLSPHGEKTISVKPLFPVDGENGSHIINVKVGIINDESLLYSIYKNESGALANLMKYAQQNQGSIFTSQPNETRLLYDDFQVQDGAYYYIYVTYENSDGMYRDLSGVTFAQGEFGGLISDIDWHFSDSEITPPGSESGEENVQSPDTGDLDMIVLTGAMILLAGASIVAYRKIKAN